MTKIFKIFKKPFETILGLFCPNLGENEFTWTKELCQFLNILIIYHCAKNQRKTNDPFLRKTLNRQTDRQTGRQRWFYRIFLRTRVQLYIRNCFTAPLNQILTLSCSCTIYSLSKKCPYLELFWVVLYIEVIKTVSSLFILFLRGKDFAHSKTCHT